MIKVDVEQGSPEWLATRAGVVSCSQLDRLVTASLKPSTQADAYMFELTAEHITGDKKYIKPSYWMERGTEMEPQARAMYELMTGNDVEQVGFIFKDDDKMVGCSPDGLIHNPDLTVLEDSEYHWGLEIKCPAPITHVSYLLQQTCPKEYMSQVQGAMWVTGLEVWDFMSFHPDYDSLIVSVERDEKWMEAFDAIIPPFVTKLQELRESDQAKHLLKQRLENAA